MLKKLFILLIVIAGITKQAKAQCNNAGFETGTFTGWVGGIGYNSNSYKPLTVTSYSINTLGINSPETGCSFHTLTTAAGGIDPWEGDPVVAPGFGNYSLRLGGENINTNQEAQTAGCTVNYPSGTPSYYSNGEYIQQTFAVTPSNMFLTYSYQVILEVAPHPDSTQPYFRIELLDQSGIPVPCYSMNFMIDTSGNVPSGFSLFTNSSGISAYYLPWQTSTLNLLPYLGTTITIKVTAAGCTQGGHFAYGYVDFSCASSPDGIYVYPQTCLGSTVALTAPPMAGATYTWTGPGIISGSNSETANVDASGTYSVTVTNALGCSYTIDTTLVFSNSVPTAVSYTLAPDTTPHSWNAFTTYSSYTDSARWYWGDGTDTLAFYPSHTYSSPCRYTICVTAYSACGDSAQYCQNDTVYRTTNSQMVYINVDSSSAHTTNLSRISSLNTQVSLYPNPNNGTFTLQLNEYENTSVEVYNIIGECVYRQPAKATTSQITMTGMANGMYQIRVLKNNNPVYQSKVVKQE